ncbi:MAG: FMN-binding negative transcriptional regulator [Spirochaetia bacterium]|nr:FMN-binding negative transcriptional regulator [Spirochaetia bacterium]
MYTPKSFEVADREKIATFIRENGFGTLYSNIAGESEATHQPFVIENFSENKMTLLCHFARANGQWKSIHGQKVLVTFLGPHAYISASWYEDPNTVPTWNYAAVHVEGIVEILEDESSLIEILKKTVNHFEGRDTAWSYTPDSDFIKGMHKAIVGARIVSTKIQGKWKLSQNHSLERKQKVIAQLSKSEHSDQKKIAKMMSEEIKSKPGI